MIADCQLPISDWRLAMKPIGKRKLESEIPEPTRYREVVLTSCHHIEAGRTVAE